MSIQDDIFTCLKMLRARGGALDMKAANLLEAMDKAGVEQNLELQALDARVTVLEGELAVVDAKDEVRQVLIGAANGLVGDTTKWSTPDLAQILANEWWACKVELNEVAGRLFQAIGANSPVSDSPLILADTAVQEINRLRQLVAIPPVNHGHTSQLSTGIGTALPSTYYVIPTKPNAVVSASDGSIWNADLETGAVWPRATASDIRDSQWTPQQLREIGEIIKVKGRD